MHRVLFFIYITEAAVAVYGCSSMLSSAGKDLGDGAMNSVSSHADSVGYNLVKGARTSLAAIETRQTLDSLLSNLGDSMTGQMSRLRESLLGMKSREDIAAIRDSLIGEVTKERLVAIRNSVLDSNFRNYVSDILARLDASARSASGGIRDSLLGQKSNTLIKAIIDTAMNDLQTRLKYEVYPELRSNLSFVERNAMWLIVLTGTIAIAIVWLIWRQREKYLRMTKMLTFRISELSDVAAKESLKASISQNAKTIGIEDDLRTLLMKQGLLS